MKSVFIIYIFHEKINNINKQKTNASLSSSYVSPSYANAPLKTSYITPPTTYVASPTNYITPPTYITSPNVLPSYYPSPLPGRSLYNDYEDARYPRNLPWTEVPNQDPPKIKKEKGFFDKLKTLLIN